jgi:hypothetical protein
VREAATKHQNIASSIFQTAGRAEIGLIHKLWMMSRYLDISSFPIALILRRRKRRNSNRNQLTFLGREELMVNKSIARPCHSSSLAATRLHRNCLVE